MIWSGQAKVTAVVTRCKILPGLSSVFYSKHQNPERMSMSFDEQQGGSWEQSRTCKDMARRRTCWRRADQFGGQHDSTLDVLKSAACSSRIHDSKTSRRHGFECDIHATAAMYPQPDHCFSTMITCRVPLAQSSLMSKY